MIMNGFGDMEHCDPQKLYERGIELKRKNDYYGAFQCFLGASDNDRPNPLACFCLAECYEHGNGVKPASHENARKRYHRAADGFNLREAQFRLSGNLKRWRDNSKNRAFKESVHIFAI